MAKRKSTKKHKGSSQRKKIPSLSLSVPRSLIIAGALLITLSLSWRFYESTKYAFLSYAGSTARAETKDRSLPTFINIPSLEISLPIVESSIHNGLWEINSEGVSHLDSSAVPGEHNNIVMYGHNTKDRLGRLTSIRKDDIIIVTTLNGEMHPYRVTDLLIVSPNEVSVIADTTKETLTLYTCYGFADLQRFVVKATPVTSF